MATDEYFASWLCDAWGIASFESEGCEDCEDLGVFEGMVVRACLMLPRSEAMISIKPYKPLGLVNRVSQICRSSCFSTSA